MKIIVNYSDGRYTFISDEDWPQRFATAPAADIHTLPDDVAAQLKAHCDADNWWNSCLHALGELSWARDDAEAEGKPWPA